MSTFELGEADEADLGKALVRLSTLIDFHQKETGERVHENSIFADGSALAVEVEYMAEALCHVTYGGHEYTAEQIADARRACTHWIGHVACLRGGGLATITLVGAFATRDRSLDETLERKPEIILP